MTAASLLRRALARLSLVFGGLALAAPALADPQSLPAPVAPKLVELATGAAAPPLKPALWKVTDDDTTIYLFGTIHALKPGLPWFDGAIAQAFAQSGTLVTEIADVGSMDTAQVLLGSAMLPAGQSLRAKLSEADRAAYDAALAKAAIPSVALDRFKPWYAAVVLSSLPLLRSGYKLEEGVEIQLAKQARASDKKQEALETAAYQLGLFDALPEASQLAYLRQVVDNFDNVTAQIDTLITEWGEGDAEGLAAQMNADKSDAELVEVLLARRNRAWAEWIDTRLDQPGTVFVAVGAGHLAGAGSVQDMLTARGIVSARVQ
ncbi:MAG TPA: TraB/GumN family protein [Novosphingobium sp.]|nr:TraB/GumN family protein [Novosphingobium sp.]